MAAATSSYSRDTIDSIVLKSASTAGTDVPSWTSPCEPPSASVKLLEGLEEAMSTISDLLLKSSDVMEQFRSEWDAALTSYQVDIGVMDEQIEQMEAERKRRTKKATTDDDASTKSQAKPRGLEAEHALNFHLKSRGEYLNDGSDIFVLPPDDNEMDITLLPDERDEARGALKDSAGETLDGNNEESSKLTKKSEDQARLESVSNLIATMQTFREEEALLVKRLDDAKPKDNGMTSLTMQERQDIEEQLEQCRARQAQQVVATVSDYKPRFKANTKSITQGASSSKKSSDLGLHLPAIEEILGSQSQTQKQVKQAHKEDRRKHLRQSPKRDRISAKGNGLTLDYTREKNSLSMDIMSDEDNLLTINELSIQNPTSKHPEPARRSLSALVKRNTRPLNAMELGRRNRVDR